LAAWTVGDHFELKNARRVLVDGNVFENIWVAAQIGFAVQFTVRDDGGTAPWTAVRDVTFTHNIARHISGGINVLGLDDNATSQHLERLLIRDNVFTDMSTDDDTRLFEILNGALDVTIDQGEGSAATVTRIMGGAYDAGFGDVNAIIQNAALRPADAPLMVYMIYSKAPFALLVKADSPIKTIADIAGKTIGRRDERARVTSQRTLIGQIGAIAHRLVADAGLTWSQVTHTAIGSPGVFDPDRGYVAMAPNLPGWGRHGLVEAVREQLGAGVTFENDVNLAAIAERDHGLGRNVRDFVLVSIGTGVGLGLVIDGRLRRGAHGAAGEIAYLPLGTGDPKDPANRRRGSFEEAAAAAGIVREARRLGMREPVTVETIFSAARRTNRTARRVLEIEAQRLALAIAAVTPVVDPQLVILGGGIGRNADLLLESIDSELQELLPFRPKLAISALGDDAVLQGAIAIALETARDRVFARPARQLQEMAG